MQDGVCNAALLGVELGLQRADGPYNFECGPPYSTQAIMNTPGERAVMKVQYTLPRYGLRMVVAPTDRFET